MQSIGMASTSTSASLVDFSTTRYRRRGSRRQVLLIMVSPHRRGFCGLYTSRRKTIVTMCHQQQPPAPEDDQDGEASTRGQLVDENMLTLRRRIGELREVVGGGVDDRLDTLWSEKTSKKHQVTLYRTDVLEVLASMQLDLQRQREHDREDDKTEEGNEQQRRLLPAMIGVGMTVMVSVTVPVSVIVVALHLIDAAKAVMDSIHSVQTLQK